MFKIGGDLYGKFIILSFDENEEAIFSNTVMALSAVSDFFSLASSDNTPLLHGTLQILSLIHI